MAFFSTLLSVLMALALVSPALGISYIGVIGVPPPSILNLSGERITTSEVDQHVIIETTFHNNHDQQVPFVMLFEVRDYRDDTTQYMAWQSGDPEPRGNATIGSVWSPTKQSDYQVRTFAISGFDNPQILSPVSDAEFFVR